MPADTELTDHTASPADGLRAMPGGHTLPRALYRAAQVLAMERLTIGRYGIPGSTLMERAGVAAFALARARWPQAHALVVLAGAGNNGGDGYVLARLALTAGLSVRLLQLGDHHRLHGEAAAAASAFAAAGGRAEPYAGLPPRTDLIIDALLGTGLERPVTGAFAAAVAAANGARVPVLAIDLPSGLHADSGRVLGCALRADATISFIGLKQGLFTGAGPELAGAVHFDALSVPTVVYAAEIAAARRLDWASAAGLLPRLRRDAHKGDQGHVLIIGGAPGLSGAGRLAAEAALRAGAGLVTLATHPAHAALANLTRPELMVQAVDDPAGLDALAARADVIAIGPGLGRDAWGQGLLARVQRLDRPLVVDADALNLLAIGPPEPCDQWVLTPHPGEAARLLGCTVAEIAADRFAAVAALQQRYGGVVVLKGAGTLIKGPGVRPVGVCSQGNPGMASAGMGDVLTGVIAALWAVRAADGDGRALGAEEAACAGVCLHAAAGDCAALAGARGLIASDLIAQLQGVLGAV